MPAPAAAPEIVIVGAGVAGSALAAVLARAGRTVLLLEKTAAHADRVRGEFMVVWGVAEAQALGLYDVLMRAGAHHTSRHVPYGEGIEPDAARSRALDLGSVLPGIPGSLCLGHPRMCDALNAAAVAAGATLLRGVEHVAVAPGAPPLVTFNAGGEERRLAPRLVVGADGRSSAVARQVGARLHRGAPHHFLAGLLVEGAEAWPVADQTIGVEGDVVYYVFPQGEGRARLYLGYARSAARRLAGADAAARFLDAFRLAYLPQADALAAARPAGPCRSYPNEEAWAEDPTAEGVVLIGDAAGYDDPTMGQGLSNAFHDARLVSDVISGGEDWTRPAFGPYAAARAERTRRQSILARFVARTRMEFGDAARARRARLAGLVAKDPKLPQFLRAPLVGPHTLPAALFDDSVWRAAMAD